MTMSHTPAATSYLDEYVVFDEIGQNQWRVLDSRVPQESSSALLGFVCIIAGLYEVTSLTRPLDVSFCADLRAARAAFADLP